MTTCTHIADCGVLGELELTISYRARNGFKGSRFERAEIDSATIYSIRLGGPNGFEVNLPDDYIADEIIPACVADWNGGADSRAEEIADRRRAA